MDKPLNKPSNTLPPTQQFCLLQKDRIQKTCHFEKDRKEKLCTKKKNTMKSIEVVLQEKIVESLSFPLAAMTRRRVKVPRIANKALAIIGMRRAGKTWFLFQLMGERLSNGVPPDHLVYINFEDERLLEIQTGHLSWLVEEYFRLVPAARDQQSVTFLFDEIQLIPGWESFVRRILDTERVEVIVSGSSAKMLSLEVATSLRGRSLATNIFPFCFSEFLDHHKVSIPSNPSLINKAQRSTLEQQFLKYLEVGGFPEAQGLEKRVRIALLQSYVDVVVLRDVLERHHISNLIALRALVRHLLANPAGRFSINRFYNVLRSQGVSVSKDLLHQMLAHLEDAFLVLTVPIWTTSERQRQSNPRKVYPIDPGLAMAYNRSSKANRGALLETVVAVELVRRGWQFGYLTTKSGLEVDFLATDWDHQTWLIQVCSETSDEEVLHREIRALEEATHQYPQAQCLLLTLTDTPQLDTIQVKPVWRWLLEGDA